MSTVTVPGGDGTNPGPPVTVTAAGADVLNLASQIGALLATIQGGGQLYTSGGTFSGPVPAETQVPATTKTELILTGNTPGSDTIPAGYNYVIDTSNAANTITGSNLTLVSGTVGGVFNISGQSTVAATGGNNLIAVNGVYLVSTAPGNDTVSASGVGTVAGDTGSNLLAVSGSNLVSSIGQDTVLSGTGVTTVNATGSQSMVFGSSTPGALLFAAVSGTQATVSTFSSNAMLTVAGSNDLAFGGPGLTMVTVSGASDTLVGGTGAETVSAATNTLMFGGTGPINFAGGSGTSTIIGTTGGTERIAAGTGGLLFSAGTTNTSNITSGIGVVTIFGGANSAVNFTGSLGGAVFVGSTGSETLNAAGSSTANLFSAGVGGNVSLVGGAGADTIMAGSGSDTMTGGAGANAFAFFAAATSGGQDYITDFNASDSLYLIGYAPGQSASTLQNAAIVGPAGVTLTLSDQTKITFTNLTSATSLNGEILYAPKTS